METITNRLTDLPLFPTGVVPKSRRNALEELLAERRTTVGRAVSNGAMLALCAVFTLFYGAFCTFAWINGGHPAFGIVLSIFSGITFVGTVVLTASFEKHLRAIVAVPARLRLEAEAETSLEQAALDLNIKAIFWNDAARAAQANRVSPTIVANLLKQRASIERRRSVIADNLKRFRATSAPKPGIVPLPAAWGPVERIDLTSRTGS